MLRVYLDAGGAPPWELSEDEFLSRIDGFAERRFAALPPGLVSVEALDGLGRVRWRACYASAAELAILARQIREGRDALARRRGQAR